MDRITHSIINLRKQLSSQNFRVNIILSNLDIYKRKKYVIHKLITWHYNKHDDFHPSRRENIYHPFNMNYAKETTRTRTYHFSLTFSPIVRKRIYIFLLHLRKYKSYIIYEYPTIFFNYFFMGKYRVHV